MEQDIKQLKAMAESCRVLYVEDEKELAGQMIEFLKKFFKEVTYAQNGSDGLKKYGEGDFDLVITDILMPELDGLEMGRRIRELDSEQDIIFMSANMEIKSILEAVNIGGDGYIIKPIELKVLIKELVRVLRKALALRENRAYRLELEKMVADKTKELKERYIKDLLTSLYNRNYLIELLNKEGTKHLLLLNIDNFSFVNDSYGLDFGDRVICITASFLERLTPTNGVLFRVGGDLFAIMLQDSDDLEAYNLALEIRAFFLEKSIDLEGAELRLTFTIGIDSGIGSRVLKNSALAIKEIRELGKNRIHHYKESSAYEQRQRDNIIWIERIRSALGDERFFPYFQPIVDIKSGKITKYESLARLKEGGEIVLPYQFLMPAKIAGLLSGITRQIVDKSFRFHRGSNVSFSINIADYDLKEGYLLNFMEQKANHYEIDPNRVILEILESISTQDTKESIYQLRELKDMGFKLAIDDFGTESSNFSRLLDLDVDFIKIDGSFIKNIDRDESSQKITESIVMFAKSIGAETVAEFVHNKSVFDKVREFGIDYAQGYYFGEPKAGI